MKDSSFVAVRFDSKEQKIAISTKHSIRGYPTAVLMNGKTGEVLDPDADVTRIDYFLKILSPVSVEDTSALSL